MNSKLTKFIEAYKESQSKYFTTVKIMLLLKNTSLIIMFISATIFICVLFNPNTWEVNISSPSSFVAYAMDPENESLPKAVTGTLNEVNKTLNEVNTVLSTVNKEGVNINVSVEPKLGNILNAAASSLLVGSAAYTGLRLAETTPSLAGKAAIVTGTLVATVAAKTIIQETNNNTYFTMKTTEDEPVDNPSTADYPPSPVDTYFYINSPNESNSLDLNALLSNLESTDSLQILLESLLTLSTLNITLTLYVLITLILNLKDFTKIAWLKDYPKLVKYIEKIKVARSSVVIPILLLLMFISLISWYGLYNVLKALLVYKNINL